MDSSQKLTNTDVKKLNKNRIFRLIYNSDKISRQEIADRLGLSLPTVNQNLKMLMEDGLIEYVGNFTSTGGRRAQAITISNNARKAISVNIKADYINVDVVGLKGQIIYSMYVKAHFNKSSAYIEKLTDAVRHAADYVGADADDILGVGITVPGILDDEKQILISAPPLKAKNYDFTKLISAIDYPVVVMNDARAEAYADHWFNGKPQDEKIYIMLGEGVGGAYINASAIRNGVHNRGGEFGHMVIHPGGKQCLCGKKGCLEAYVSEKVLSSELNTSLEDFFAQAEKGKPDYVDMLEEYIDNLALGINNIYTMMDCDIVLGGTVAPYIKRYEDRIKECLVNDYSFDTDADYLKISDDGGGKSGLGAALSFVARFIDGVE
ncbi:ROK family transcriptional regulator [Lachnospira eligens]|jgi:predicted NBD/HSP70 family sugar kinase|uniref:ROK family transcriptional regulator n=1 Tax=Lachnospira eligens TaxID=39485 RepID=A0A413YWF5_9FIRM|nr:ROK family transcriptional regulator [Lachnospira eligens]RHC13410.1 ROK family transcriptional regulator [Lachnospira eligens]